MKSGIQANPVAGRAGKARGLWLSPALCSPSSFSSSYKSVSGIGRWLHTQYRTGAYANLCESFELLNSSFNMSISLKQLSVAASAFVSTRQCRPGIGSKIPQLAMSNRSTFTKMMSVRGTGE
jgi:hypothetical protein